ncbi:hypothetical protein EVAR_62528_1 [Eumeta japonica]|uniref:Uncharacterized protein n=1 Tax=Eumeta variegata TaxID=151549 RepID=A0A4C1ZIT9_EUMVA|nr:hypothetical protein EVAR_62528_1 [Eumeta japonica]
MSQEMKQLYSRANKSDLSFRRRFCTLISFQTPKRRANNTTRYLHPCIGAYRGLFIAQEFEIFTTKNRINKLHNKIPVTKKYTVQLTKLRRSELPANNIMRRLDSPRPFLLLRRVPISRHCDAFETDLTAAELLALYCTLVNVKLHTIFFYLID